MLIAHRGYRVTGLRLIIPCQMVTSTAHPLLKLGVFLHQQISRLFQRNDSKSGLIVYLR